MILMMMMMINEQMMFTVKESRTIFQLIHIQHNCIIIIIIQNPSKFCFIIINLSKLKPQHIN